MVSPCGLFRGSLEYISWVWQPRVPGSICCDHQHRDLVPALEGFENPLSPAPGSLIPPAPSPSSHPLAGSRQWPYPSKRAVSCPGFLCWRGVKNSLLLPVTIPCLSWVHSKPCGCSRCQSPGIQLANVFIVCLCEHG